MGDNMIIITKDLNAAKFVTHAGNFHADDVFSTIFLEKLFGNITVIRLKEYIDDGTKLAYDIGCGKFDHHQKDLKVRDNGIHYCGFGLLWQEYGLEYLKRLDIENYEVTFNVFDYLLVNGIDAIDNGEFTITSDFNVYPAASLIELFRPKYEEDKDEDECFLEACNFAKIIFDLILKEAISKVSIIEKLKTKISDIKEGILVLDEFIPYEYALFYLKIDKLVDFVVYPSNRGGYAAHTIPTIYKGFTPKIPFKSEWGGLRNEELQKASGVGTARFCHRALFLATADTLSDAIKLITISQKDYQDKLSIDNKE